MGEYTKPSTSVGTIDRPTFIRYPNGWKPDRDYALDFYFHNWDAQHGNLAVDSAGLDVRGRMDFDQVGSFDDGNFSIVANGLLDSGGHRFLNASAACCDTENINPDDIGYFVQVFNNVIAAGWRIDRTRVNAKGYSNGAFLAIALGCHHPEIWTHVLAVAGASDKLDGSGCSKAKNVTCLLLHGDGDTTVPYAGGVGNPPVSNRIPVTNVCSAIQTAMNCAANNGVTGQTFPGTPTVTQGIITTGTPSGSGAETDFYDLPGTPADGLIRRGIMNGGNHAMVFETGAGQRLHAFLHAHPRLS